MPDGRVEVLVAHRNNVEALGKLLRALEAQTVRPAACVIDDASTDETPEVVPRDFPWVRYERLEENVGFARANNHGIRTSNADLLLLLNNDTVPEPGLVASVLAARERTGADMVAICLRRPDGAIDTAGVDVDQSLVDFDLLHGEPYDAARIAALRPLAPCAGAGAYLRAALLEVGGFDEEMFAYLEDVELGIRLRMAGARCAVAESTFAWHEHSSYWGSGSARKNERLGESRAYVAWKYRNDLSSRERLRAAVVDVVVSVGKVAIDRNAGAIRGRLRRARSLRGRPSPPAHRGFSRVPRTAQPLHRALARRLLRRRLAAAAQNGAGMPQTAEERSSRSNAQ